MKLSAFCHRGLCFLNNVKKQSRNPKRLLCATPVLSPPAGKLSDWQLFIKHDTQPEPQTAHGAISQHTVTSFSALEMRQWGLMSQWRTRMKPSAAPFGDKNPILAASGVVNESRRVRWRLNKEHLLSEMGINPLYQNRQRRCHSADKDPRGVGPCWGDEGRGVGGVGGVGWAQKACPQTSKPPKNTKLQNTH